MDDVYWLYKGQEASVSGSSGISEGLKREGDGRKGASRMWSLPIVSNVQRQNFSPFIRINPYFVNIID